MRRIGNWPVNLFGLGLLAGLVIHAGLKYGLKGALLYFAVFGIIIGFLIFVNLFFSK